MSVITALEALPTSGLTITALQTLDKAIPGEWQNVTLFDQLASDATGQTHPAVLAAVRERAAKLELEHAHYGRALQIFQLIDTADQVAAGAAVASKAADLAGSMFGSLSFLKQYTPKPDTTQAVDAGLKLVAEALAFGLVNGMPTTEPGALKRFAGALEDYGRYDLMRIAAWVVFDGLVPLGPDFLSRITGTLKDAAGSSLTDNPVFSQLSGQLPGKTSQDKRSFLIDTVDTTTDWVGRFIADKKLTQQGALKQLSGVFGVADSGLDYLAAAIDASTAYTSHTGTQTVARALARQATEQLRDDVWKEWVAELKP